MALVGILDGAKVSLQESFSLLWQLLASFGDPAGFQKSTKSRSLAEKASPEATFLVIFLMNLQRFLTMFLISSCHLCFLFFSVFFGICGGSGGLVLLVILVLFVGGWVVVVCQDRNTTGQQHDGTVRRQHSNTERRQHVKTARQQDSMTKIQQHNNLTIQRPIDVARRNARSD